MTYNFTSVNKRYHTGSAKWEEIRKVLPGFDGDIVPFSVADMEFENAPEIREGLKSISIRMCWDTRTPQRNIIRPSAGG